MGINLKYATFIAQIGRNVEQIINMSIASDACSQTKVITCYQQFQYLVVTSGSCAGIHIKLTDFLSDIFQGIGFFLFADDRSWAGLDDFKNLFHWHFEGIPDVIVNIWALYSDLNNIQNFLKDGFEMPVLCFLSLRREHTSSRHR